MSAFDPKRTWRQGLVERDVPEYPASEQPHCGLMPAIFTTLSHFAASAAM